jgi:hypothetical protein
LRSLTFLKFVFIFFFVKVKILLVLYARNCQNLKFNTVLKLLLYLPLIPWINDWDSRCYKKLYLPIHIGLHIHMTYAVASVAVTLCSGFIARRWCGSRSLAGDNADPGLVNISYWPGSMDQKSWITDPDPGCQFITDRPSRNLLDCIMM